MKTTNIRWSIVGIITAVFLTAGTGWAQSIGDPGFYENQELDIDDLTGNVTYSANYYVGDTGGNNTLTVTDNYTLTFNMSSWPGVVIGRSTGGDNNKIIVEQGGTLTMLDEVGHSATAFALGGNGATTGGSYNELVVNGGAVTNFRRIRVGDGLNSTGNTLRVQNNGTLSLRSGEFILLGTRTGSTQSGLEITGANSTVTLPGTGYLILGFEPTGVTEDWVTVDAGTLTTGIYMWVGRNGSNNTFDITNNGTVNVGSYLNIGQNSTSNNNTLTVNNGTLSTGTYLMVGHSGANNTLDVTNDASVTISTNMHVGRYSTSNENEVTVSNATLTVGDTLYLGNVGSDNSMTVSGGGRVDVGIDPGASDREVRIGHTSSSENNVLRVTGEDSEFVANGTIFVSPVGAAGNTLKVDTDGFAQAVTLDVGTDGKVEVESGGELVTTGNMLINSGIGSDYDPGDPNSEKLVGLKITGATSQATANGAFLLGDGASDNTVKINGGTLTSTGIFYLGNASSSNNTVDVTNGTLIAESHMLISRLSTTGNNTLRIGNNGSVTVGGTYLVLGTASNDGTSSDNLLEVDGEGARLTVNAWTWIGANGTGNELKVLNGGNATFNGDLRIARTFGATDNTVLVDGSDGINASILHATGRVEVGTEGSGNTLTVSNGGRVNATGGTFIGYTANGAETPDNNLLLVTGDGSRYEESGTLTVGLADSTGNTVQVDTDGYVQAGTLDVIANGTVKVQSGGELVTAADMRISSGLGPDYDPGAVDPEETRLAGLDISGATSSATSTGRFRLGNASSDNLVTVRDGGTLNVAGILYVSDESAASHGNRLVVENATVNQTNAADLGRLQIGSNVTTSPGTSSVLVTGPDAALNVAGFLWLGPNTQNNSLEILDGANAGFGGVAWIGRYSDGGNNTLTVDGVNGTARSTVTSGNSFGVGNLGSDNTTVISGGALVSVPTAYIGVGGSASNNLLHVTGAGSEFISSATLHVGSSTQAGNTLQVNAGGRAESVLLNVYANATVEVDDGIVSTWNMTVDEDAQVTLSGNALLHVGTGWAGVNTHGESNNLLRVVGTGVLTANGGIDLGAGGTLVVEEGGTVQGATTITGNADVYGVLSPGNSAGTLDFTGSLTLRTGSEVYIELGADGESDLITADSILVEGGTIYFSVLNGYQPVYGHSFQIFNLNGGGGDILSGVDFEGYDYTGLPLGWEVDDTDLYSLGTVTIIPEPHSLGLILIGLGAVALRRRLRAGVQ